MTVTSLMGLFTPELPLFLGLSLRGRAKGFGGTAYDYTKLGIPKELFKGQPKEGRRQRAKQKSPDGNHKTKAEPKDERRNTRKPKKT